MSRLLKAENDAINNPYQSPGEVVRGAPVTSASSLKRQALWVVACRVVGIAATLASNIVVARLLGPGEFGTYLLITTVMALGGIIAMAGLNEAALRFISESLAHGQVHRARSYLGRALSMATIASFVSAGVVTGGLAILLYGKSMPQATLLLGLVAVGIVVLGWQQLGAEFVRAYGDLRIASLFSGGQAGGPVSNLLFLVGIGLAAWSMTKLDATLAVGITVVSLLVTCPLLYGMLSRLSRAPVTVGPEQAFLSMEQRRELFMVSGVLLANQLLAFATQQLDIWLAGGLLTAEDLGLYGAAKRALLIAAMPVQMAMLTIVSTIPRLYAQNRKQELERVMRGAATLAAVPSLIAILILVLFPRQMLTIVLGSAYASAAPVLLVMSVGHLVLVLSGNPQHVLTMTGRHRAVLFVNLLCAIVLVVGGACLARRFGAAGLAAASAASLALQNGILWWLARRDLGVWTHVYFFGKLRQRVRQFRGQDARAVAEPSPAPDSVIEPATYTVSP